MTKKSHLDITGLHIFYHFSWRLTTKATPNGHRPNTVPKTRQQCLRTRSYTWQLILRANDLVNILHHYLLLNEQPGLRSVHFLRMRFQIRVQRKCRKCSPNLVRQACIKNNSLFVARLRSPVQQQATQNGLESKDAVLY